MGEYASNSHKSKEKRSEQVPEKRVEKIVSGSVKAKKKSGLQKITNVFVPEDVDNVKSYILEDIVVPAVKDIILDAVRAFLGVNGKSGGRSTNASKVSYRKYYEEIEPANAEKIYKQVLNELQYTEKAKELGTQYSNMDAASAAKILTEMSEDLDLVCDILENMKESQAAQILQNMDSDYAAQITKKIAAVKDK